MPSTWTKVAPSLYRHNRTGRLYERSVISGRPTFRKLANYKVEAAKKEMIEARSQRLRIERGLEKKPDAKHGWPVRKALEVYREANCPDRTLSRRPERSESEEKRRVAVLLRFFKHELICDLGPEVFDDYAKWRMKYVRKGSDGRRATDLEFVTLSNALSHSNISTEALANRRKFYQPSKARHARDCAPVSGDELHDVVANLFAGHFATQILGWQALFEAFTGVRTNEALAWRMDAKKQGAGYVDRLNKCLWLHRSKSGVNPWVSFKDRPELRRLIRAHHEWHQVHFPDSPWYFPNYRQPLKPADVSALNKSLSRLHKAGMIPRKITSHGMRAFYVLVRRSQGTPDAQIAAEIGDKTASLIQTTYGPLPTNWRGGKRVAFMPSNGEPAWTHARGAINRKLYQEAA